MKRWFRYCVVRPLSRHVAGHARFYSYLWANMVEAGLAWAFAVAGIWQLVERNDKTAVARVWGSPWDVIITTVGTGAALTILGCLFLWSPRVRAFALVMMGFYLVELAVAADHVRGFHVALPALAAYLGPALAFFGRAMGIMLVGDYPPRGLAGRRITDHPRSYGP